MIEKLSEEIYTAFMITLPEYKDYTLMIMHKNNIIYKIEFRVNNEKNKSFIIEGYDAPIIQGFIDLLDNYLTYKKLNKL